MSEWICEEWPLVEDQCIERNCTRKMPFRKNLVELKFNTCRNAKIVHYISSFPSSVSILQAYVQFGMYHDEWDGTCNVCGGPIAIG